MVKRRKPRSPNIHSAPLNYYTITPWKSNSWKRKNIQTKTSWLSKLCKAKKNYFNFWTIFHNIFFQFHSYMGRLVREYIRYLYLMKLGKRGIEVQTFLQSLNKYRVGKISPTGALRLANGVVFTTRFLFLYEVDFQFKFLFGSKCVSELGAK